MTKILISLTPELFILTRIVKLNDNNHSRSIKKSPQYDEQWHYYTLYKKLYLFDNVQRSEITLIVHCNCSSIIQVIHLMKDMNNFEWFKNFAQFSLFQTNNVKVYF